MRIWILLRLGVKRVRAELAIFTGLAAVMLASAAGLAWTIHSAIYGPGCHEDTRPDQIDVNALLQFVPYERLVLIGTPVLAGVALAAGVVAAEFEADTIAFSWSVVLRRVRWFLDAFIFGSLALLVVSIGPAIGAWALSWSLGPRMDAMWSPAGIDTAPVLVILRPIVAFGLTAVVALLSRRILPTFLGGLIMSCLVLGLLEVGFSAWAQSSAGTFDASADGSLFVRTAMVNDQGDMVTSDQAALDAASRGRSVDELYRPVDLGLAPAQRQVMVIAETAIEAGLALVILASGVWLVDRRGNA